MPRIKGHACSLFPPGPADKLRMWISGKQRVRGVAAPVSAQMFGFHGFCANQGAFERFAVSMSPRREGVPSCLGAAQVQYERLL